MARYHEVDEDGDVDLLLPPPEDVELRLDEFVEVSPPAKRFELQSEPLEEEDVWAFSSSSTKRNKKKMRSSWTFEEPLAEETTSFDAPPEAPPSPPPLARDALQDSDGNVEVSEEVEPALEGEDDEKGKRARMPFCDLLHSSY